MLTFFRGEAHGQVLQLRRAPLFLRVVLTEAGEWDALDQPEDEIAPDETGHTYVMAVSQGNYHISVRGKGRGRSGFYPQAIYVHYPLEPKRYTNDDWRRFVNGELGLPAGQKLGDPLPSGYQIPHSHQQWREGMAQYAQDWWRNNMRRVIDGRERT